MKYGDSVFVLVFESYIPRSGKFVCFDGAWFDIQFGESIERVPRSYVFSSFSAAVRATI